MAEVGAMNTKTNAVTQEPDGRFSIIDQDGEKRYFSTKEQAQKAALGEQKDGDPNLPEPPPNQAP